MTSATSTTIADSAARLLAAEHDVDRAAHMASYMKTDMAFYGVGSQSRKAIAKRLTQAYPAMSRSEYETGVRALWHGAHREEKYLAIAYARAYPRFVTLSSVPLYRTMITQGAWWDFVDEIASHLVGTVLRNQRGRLTPTIEAWTVSEDMWLRRTSILSQLRHKDDTDTRLLDVACTRNIESTEFFIRKAIGWALREYARTDPSWVLCYVGAHEREMSGLTFREATKHL
jgi:3-methyladenine DNA glycosylase AlkD